MLKSYGSTAQTDSVKLLEEHQHPIIHSKLFVIEVMAMRSIVGVAWMTNVRDSS
jgi:hypothetical protein